MSEIKGMVQMWGIYMPNKEANMYPKPVQDLSGWEIRSIACNSKVSPAEPMLRIPIHLIRNILSSWIRILEYQPKTVKKKNNTSALNQNLNFLKKEIIINFFLFLNGIK